jgi:histidinol phosphatase-like enzyme (inositol monophosphatase family)
MSGVPTFPGRKETSELTEFALKLADAAKNITLSYFRTAMPIENKASAGAIFDPVTIADQNTEKVIRDIINSERPEDAIFGEEHPLKTGTSGYSWHIDPIDGTRSFIAGVPLWGTLIGLEYNCHPIIGIVDQPYIGERFIGTQAGAFLRNSNGTANIQTSRCQSIETAILATTSPHLFTPGDEFARYQTIEKRARLTRYGGDCYFYAMLAAGHIDLVVEAGLNPYDIVALIPLVEAAGGIISTWKNESAEQGGQIVAAATKELHVKALKILSGH